MKNIKNYVELSRLNRPIGVWLLFLPCLFGINLAYKNNPTFHLSDLYYIIFLFFAGSIFMRSAGCIINDIFDRKFDKKVKRTKSRPIASGKITVKAALAFLMILLLMSLIILLQFNHQTILLGFSFCALVVLYPLTKRFTYYPQIFLGLTFNSGVLIAGTAILGEITLPIFMLYISSIIWTITYDTIYAYQDIEDDLQIGVKSTAIKFGKNPQKLLYLLTIIQFSLLALIGLLMNLYPAYYLFTAIAFFHLLCQIRSCDFNNSDDCLKRFKSNIWVGIFVAIAIALG